VNPTFGQPLTVYQIQLFLRWLAKTRTGQLEDIITDTTLRNRLSSLKQAIKTYTSCQYNATENKQLENFVTKELVQDGKITTGAYTKLVAPLLVAKDLIQFM
jgi:hypothetical protein